MSRSARMTVLAAIAAGTTVLTACAGVGSSGGASSSTKAGAAPSGALKIMGFSGTDEVATSRVAAFKSAYPAVKVTNNKGDFDAQQFLTALASGNPPDLVYMSRELVGTYAAQGAIQPLTSCISSAAIDTSQYYPSALNQVTVGGKVYGIPEFYIVDVNLVDTSVLGKAGLQLSDIQTKDWPALQTTATKLFQSSGSKISRIGYDPKLPDDFPLWAMANGATLINADGSPNLADPKAVEALAYTVGLVKAQGGWNSFNAFRSSFDFFGEKNEFAAHQLGAMPMENWYVNVLTASLKKGISLGSTMYTDRQGNPVSTLGGQAWVIPKGAKNTAAACAWAKTMTTTDTWMKAAQARMATVTKTKTFFTGLFTGNTAADAKIKAAYQKPTGDAGFDQAIANYYTVLPQAKALNPSPVGSQISDAWKSAVSKALAGTAPQAALSAAQQTAQAAFDKAKQGG